MKTQEILKEKIDSLHEEISNKAVKVHTDFIETLSNKLNLGKEKIRVNIDAWGYEITINVIFNLKGDNSWGENFSFRVEEKRDWNDYSKVSSKKIEVSSSSIRFTLDDKEGLEHIKVLSSVVNFLNASEKFLWSKLVEIQTEYKNNIHPLRKEIEKLEQDIKVLNERDKNEELAFIEKEYVKENGVVFVSKSLRNGFPISSKRSATFIRFGKVKADKIECYMSEYGLIALDDENYRKETYDNDHLEKRNVNISEIVNFIYINKDKYITNWEHPMDAKGHKNYDKDIYFKIRRISFDFNEVGTELDKTEITEEEYKKIKNS